jgi:hypothetical protein
MKLPQETVRLLHSEATACREALRLIVEVFRDGHRAASDLRSTAGALTPGELQDELDAIESHMLSQIARICNTYQIPTQDALPN